MSLWVFCGLNEIWNGVRCIRKERREERKERSEVERKICKKREREKRDEKRENWCFFFCCGLNEICGGRGEGNFC